MNADEMYHHSGGDQSVLEPEPGGSFAGDKPFTDPVCGMKVRDNPEKPLSTLAPLTIFAVQVVPPNSSLTRRST